MATIELTDGKAVILDDEDLAWAQQYRWKLVRPLAGHHHGFYAVRFGRFDGKWTSRLMHREMLNAPRGLTVDHINGNGLDNRRANLRLATTSQNKANTPVSRHRQGKLKGAYKVGRNRWQASITVHNKARSIGYFKTEQEAHDAWWAEAQKAHGEFARKG